MKRIGIFQYEWPLQNHTLNLAIKLAENGFMVDLFLYESNPAYVNLSTVASNPAVKFIRYERSLARKIVDKLISVIQNIRGSAPSQPVKERVVIKTFSHFLHVKYDYLIGVEKKGLIWAGMISEKLRIPYLYYSLELYIEGHPAFDNNSDFCNLRIEERKYHYHSAGTIIQDSLRANVLLQNNGIVSTDIIFFPVSVTGGIVREKSSFLHKKLSIDASNKIILFMGQICLQRSVHELLKNIDLFNEGFVLVLHGPVSNDIPRNNKYGDRVIFSQDLVDSSRIPEMVSSAHIGLAFYNNDIVNDRLTAFSSEKIAYYMQCGLPIIAYSNESYLSLMNQYKCGELIEHISHLSAAIKKIDANYDYYRQNSFLAFDKYYAYDTNINNLCEYLSNSSIQKRCKFPLDVFYHYYLGS